MRRGLLLALTLLALGCGQGGAPEVSRAPAKSPAVVLREEGDALAAKGDYAAAAAKYEAAIALASDDVGLHFVLGSAFSHLNRRPDAIREFRWVLTHGQPESEEAQGARRWLVAAGALAEEAEEGREASATAAAGPAPIKTGLTGKVDWPGINPGDPTVAVRVMLTGDDVANQQFKDARIARVGGRYTFPDLSPGTYRLTGTAMRPETPLWDQKVTIERGKMTALDLSPGNSSARPDALAGRDQR